MPYLPILDVLKSYFDIKEDDREYIVKKKLNYKILQLGEGFQGVLPPFQDLLSLKAEDTFIAVTSRSVEARMVSRLALRESGRSGVRPEFGGGRWPNAEP